MNRKLIHIVSKKKSELIRMFVSSTCNVSFSLMPLRFLFISGFQQLRYDAYKFDLLIFILLRFL